MDWDHNVVTHELVHSWNGKFRRPADLWTPDYRTPMQNSLLWLYEGQTQFWGWVLAARSGIQSKDTILGTIALAAANYAEGQPGRARSEEHTSELQSLMRISYAVFCLKKKNKQQQQEYFNITPHHSL